MPLYFIEMGQGIVGSGYLRVCTSTLHTCTLIAGYNERTGYGGAFHYPARTLKDTEVRADMAEWANLLKPTHVTLVFAQDASGGLYTTMEMGTPRDDREALQDWAQETCRVDPETKRASAGGMGIVKGGYEAGDIKDLAGDYTRSEATRLDGEAFEGRSKAYGGYTLVGKNREKL